MDIAIQSLISHSKGNELTHGQVIRALKPYAKPRDKIRQLIKKGVLVPLKKGFYILGEYYRKKLICKELIANLLYGPSYVSLEWALAYHGLIPERVMTVTSVTSKRNKDYSTSIGDFSYSYLHQKRYSYGFYIVELAPYESFLIATKEKALCDFLVLRRGKVTSSYSMEEILIEDMRVDEEELQLLDLNSIKKINQLKSHSALKFLIKVLEKYQHA